MLILALVEPVFVWQKNVKKKKLAHAKIVHGTNSLDVFSNSSLRARARMLVAHHHVFFFQFIDLLFFFSVIHAVTVVTVQCLVAE